MRFHYGQIQRKCIVLLEVGVCFEETVVFLYTMNIIYVKHDIFILGQPVVCIHVRHHWLMSNDFFQVNLILNCLRQVMTLAVDVQFQETFYGENMFLQSITKHFLLMRH